MLVLRLLVMVLTIICLMDGHAEVSSSTTGIRDRRESPPVNTNDSEVEILDRKKKKKPKPNKKKKPKPGKKKKPNNKKPVTPTPTVSTSTLKTTTILTTPTVATTVTTTTTTVSPTTTATTTKTTTSTASATTTLSTTTSATTSATTTTVATSSTASTTITTIPTTATTSSPPTTAATTADSGAGGECKATNGKPCIFPFKDGNEEYNECKNEGGKYFWCATSVYDSGKYKHWSYCSTDGPCPLEGDDGECRATNNKPCVFPFKDGNKEYNECADHGGKYFWCATGTNSAGKYTAWSECPKDGSCPLPQKGTTPPTSTTTTASTTPPTNDTSAAAIAIANVENALTEINDTLQNLETAGFSEDEKQLLETMSHLSDYLESGSQTRNWNFYDAVKINSMTQQLYSSTANIKASKQVNPGFKSAHQSADATCSIKVKNAKLAKVNAGPGRMFQLDTISEILGIITNAPSSSVCCAECKALAADSELFEHSRSQKQCDCYKTKLGVPPKTMGSANLDSGVCQDEGVCKLTREANMAACPDGYRFIVGRLGKDKFTKPIPSPSHVIQHIETATRNECHKACENDKECKSFYYKTSCKKIAGVPDCLILRLEKPDSINIGRELEEKDTEEQLLKDYAFCWKIGGNVPSKNLKQYRCYSYNNNKGTDWVHTVMWHIGFRIPIFSIAKLKQHNSDHASVDKQDPSAYESDDEINFFYKSPKRRKFKYCGGQVNTFDEFNTVPTTNEFNDELDNRYTRGHLLGAQFFRNYFPGTLNARIIGQNLISNIFPQTLECNTKGSIFNNYEIMVNKKASECIKLPKNERGTFYYSHVVIPSFVTHYYGRNHFIHHVDLIYSNWCCTSHDKKTIWSIGDAMFENGSGECRYFREAPHYETFVAEISKQKDSLNLDDNANKKVHPFISINTVSNPKLKCFVDIQNDFKFKADFKILDFQQ